MSSSIEPSWEIRPFAGVGPVDLRATRSDVQRSLGSSTRQIKKGGSLVPTDVFGDSDIYVFYDDSGRVQFVEVFGGVDVRFKHVPLLGKNLASTVRNLRALGCEPSDLEGSMLCAEEGFVLSLDGDEISAVGVFVPGYYDQLLRKG